VGKHVSVVMLPKGGQLSRLHWPSYFCVHFQLANFLLSTKCKCESVIDKILVFYVWQILQTVQHEMMLLYAVCIGTES
jgi:hypothetical protein